MSTPPPAIRWDGQALELLDQTQLPDRIAYEPQPDLETVWRAIKALKVRGAPAIGVATAYGLVVAMQRHADLAPDAFRSQLTAAADYIKTARPTAVNLAWAADQMLTVAAAEPTIAALTRHAERIHAEDEAMCTAIGEAGVDLLRSDSRVLTHCNAGALAVSAKGTATAPMYLAHERGVPFSVYADETRPLLQGARLTSWELAQAGIDVTLICDNMAATLMQQGEVDLVIVGTDRIAANGDVVNKIGTLGVAVLANHYDVPFYVACPASTFDPNTPTGADVPIEERARDEVTGRWELDGVNVRNPAFDATPAELVAGYITNVGLLTRDELPQLAAANGSMAP
ncbi:MAG: S-methyl-5-thioribose-1-phosphate isomerase [Pseudomonadota bacterium]